MYDFDKHDASWFLEEGHDTRYPRLTFSCDDSVWPLEKEIQEMQGAQLLRFNTPNFYVELSNGNSVVGYNNCAYVNVFNKDGDILRKLSNWESCSRQYLNAREMEKNYQVLGIARIQRHTLFGSMTRELLKKVVELTGDVVDEKVSENTVCKK